MSKIARVLFTLAAVIAVAAVPIALAGSVVDQGAGAPRQIPWRVSLSTPGGSAATSGAMILAPGVPTNVAVSTVTAAATGLTAGQQYRLVCNADVFYRVGTGTPTAVTTDNDLPARVIEYVMLPAGMTAFAFITSTGTGVCKLGLIPAL
jgi:hypothetical protein